MNPKSFSASSTPPKIRAKNLRKKDSLTSKDCPCLLRNVSMNKYSNRNGNYIWTKIFKYRLSKFKIK